MRRNILHQVVLFEVGAHQRSVQSVELVVHLAPVLNRPAVLDLGFVHQHGLLCRLQGGLSAEGLQRLMPVHPDLILGIQVNVDLRYIPQAVKLRLFRKSPGLLGELRAFPSQPGNRPVNPVAVFPVQVMGHDTTIGLAASQGNFQLNVFMPVMIYDFLESVNLLADACDSFRRNCAEGIRPNRERIDENLRKSLMLVTALNPHIGYENAAKIAKLAHKEGTTLKEAALKLGLVSEEDFDAWVDPSKMV